MSSTEQRADSGTNKILSYVVIAALVLLVVCGALVWMVNRGDGADAQTGPRADNCSETVTVSVAPRIEKVVRQGLTTVDLKCVEFSIGAATDYQVVDSAVIGGTVPDIWVPDGDWSLAKVPVDVIAQSVASTPVVLVSRKDVEAPASWSAAMTAGTVGTQDPLKDSVGAATILAPRQEAEKLGTDLEAAQQFLTPMAQRFGQAAAEGRRIPYRFTSAKLTKGRYVASSEEEFLNQAADFPDLRMVVPPSGAPLIKFPIAVRVGASQDVRDSALALKAWITSGPGREALASANLRGPEGQPLIDAEPKIAAWLPDVQSDDLDQYRLSWNTWSVPSSILAIYDVSSAMAAPSADGSLIDLARDVSDVALTIYPRHSKIGAWAFSQNLGTKDKPYEVMAPLRRLGEEIDGQTQRDLLGEAAAEIPGMVGGDSGLYDTILAGYKQAVADYDQHYANNFVVFTDGSADRTSSISQEQLVTDLTGLYDKERSVRIIVIKLGAAGDLAPLQEIAAATTGNAHEATTPTDILKVFASEIANRS